MVTNDDARAGVVAPGGQRGEEEGSEGGLAEFHVESVRFRFEWVMRKRGFY